ncbi:hypothetical protein phytr_11350 [Candidatus Phycorickettsia trachydisci]|uniref:Uncharacterized protein n=1 Tax=Candidatus Phycorickettsia trachydisci TaxID=2115978 RepID=A0A2P1P9X5_9RICK|nr:ankyrin repeat domain-containing protein [Candidatus Phycorickettsia trachydisci]AVP88060.1 hypothetical protein phytr_11350 [Candidatus Phycorickettsia trachydisci]
MKGHVKIVNILLERGANINHKTNEGFTALHIAAQEGQLETVHLLLLNDKIELYPERDGLQPLHLAAQGGHCEVIKELMSLSKIDINAEEDSRDRTPLYLAVKLGKYEAVKLLLTYDNIDINYESMGGTPLYRAACDGYAEIVELLLGQKGIKVNKGKDFSNTPLYGAVVDGHYNIVKLLLSHDEIECNTETYYNNTPLTLAAQNGHIEVLKILLAHQKVKITDETWPRILFNAAKNEHLETVKFLLPISQITSDTLGAIFARTAEFGKDNIIKLLLTYDELEINNAKIWGVPAIHMAAANNRIKVLKLLLDCREIDVNIKNSSGETALHRAASSGHIKVTQMLLSHKKADLNSKDLKGITPIQAALKNNNTDIMKLLREYGANFNVLNDKGLSLLDISISKKYSREVILLLYSFGVLPKSLDEANAYFIKKKHEIFQVKNRIYKIAGGLNALKLFSDLDIKDQIHRFSIQMLEEIHRAIVDKVNIAVILELEKDKIVLPDLINACQNFTSNKVHNKQIRQDITKLRKKIEKILPNIPAIGSDLTHDVVAGLPNSNFRKIDKNPFAHFWKFLDTKEQGKLFCLRHAKYEEESDIIYSKRQQSPLDQHEEQLEYSDQSVLGSVESRL